VRYRLRIIGIATGIALSLLAIFVYLVADTPPAVGPTPAAEAHGLGQQQIDAMIARLASRLERNPQDAEGWIMLARAQAVLGRFDESTAAYARSVALFPDNAQILADYADALAMAQGKRFQGEPERLVERALRADPDNAKALALAGTIAFDHKDFALAVKHWERLRGSIPKSSEFGKSIQHSIDKAKHLAAARPDKGIMERN